MNAHTSTVHIPQTALPSAVRKSDLAADTNSLVVTPDSSLFAAAEKAIDNGLHLVFVTDSVGSLVGCVTLPRIREAILTGEYLRQLTVRPFIEQAPDNGLATPIVDADGRLIDVHIRQNAAFVPVAEPMLSHREFRYLLDAYLSTWISSTGDYIRRFESAFAARFGHEYGVATSNGTVSLHLALRALNVGPGDEVIVPDFTFAATANAVIYCGATPVLVDVDPSSWCMSASSFAKAITPRTRVVMPVHVFGRVAEIAEIAEVARKHGIVVVEDCAEAHGARYSGRNVGEYSTIASFSFFANKIITSGEGGMCLTSSPELARTMQTLRDHGMSPDRRYWHEAIGFNYRMTNMQAAIGLAQLERLDSLLEIRQRLEREYRMAMSDIPGVEFADFPAASAEPVVWFVCATVPEAQRATLIAECRKANIDVRPFFNSLSTMPAYAPYARNNPVSDRIARCGVNLPTSHRVDSRTVSTIADIFASTLRRP